MNVNISTSFKQKTAKAIAAITLFILVYLTLFTLALVLMAACLAGAFLMITSKPSLFTLIFGAGLAVFGSMIVYFLIKFMFKTHKTDLSNLTLITRTQQPELFAFIDGIVKEVGTPFPNKIYISPDVNASVFYDSSFWSMFLPIKKNLHIGMGLVNTITEEEFKAILAHEFGHFSQKSMKVGSYVYNVNQVIYNMLYENDSYNSLINSISGKNVYMNFFIGIAVKVVEGIQWILRKLYNLVNLSYMELSREMEFHSDAVAANVTGYLPLKDSLLRMDLADNSFNSVIRFYDDKIENCVISRNFFEEQRFVMNFLAEQDAILIENGLPVVTEENSRFNRSRLVIKNQWASHPETSERIAALEKLNLVKELPEKKEAKLLFSDLSQWQQKLTDKIFENVTYEKEPVSYSLTDFEKEYSSYYASLTFDKRYNNYYDNKNPLPFALDSVAEMPVNEEELFGQAQVDKVYELLALQNDGYVLDSISNKQYSVTTFDYEGIKYHAKDAAIVKQRNDAMLKALEEEVLQHDKRIYATLYHKAKTLNKAEEYRGYYERFFNYDTEYDKRFQLYTDVSEALRFTAETLPYSVIISKFKKAAVLENTMKEQLKALVNNPIFMFELSEEQREEINNYLSKDWVYFDTDTYIEKNIDMLMQMLHNFQFLNHRGFYLTKRSLLKYQAELLD